MGEPAFPEGTKEVCPEPWGAPARAGVCLWPHGGGRRLWLPHRVTRPPYRVTRRLRQPLLSQKAMLGSQHSHSGDWNLAALLCGHSDLQRAHREVLGATVGVQPQAAWGPSQMAASGHPQRVPCTGG